MDLVAFGLVLQRAIQYTNAAPCHYMTEILIKRIIIMESVGLGDLEAGDREGSQRVEAFSYRPS